MNKSGNDDDKIINLADKRKAKKTASKQKDKPRELKRRGRPPKKPLTADELASRVSHIAPNYRHEPTQQMRARVTALKACNVSHEAIAAEIGIDSKTLVKYYSMELETAFRTIATKLLTSLTASALSGDKGDRRFWLSNFAGIGQDARRTRPDYVENTIRPVVEAEKSSNTDARKGLPEPDENGFIHVSMKIGQGDKIISQEVLPPEQA